MLSRFKQIKKKKAGLKDLLWRLFIVLKDALYIFPKKYEYNINVFGLRRSGNHHVIDCVLSSFKKNEVEWYNDLQIKNLCVYDNKKRVTSSDSTVPEERRIILNDSNSRIKKCLIRSYEDKDLTLKIISPRVKSKNAYNILIIRDIFNNYTSRFFLSERSGLCEDSGTTPVNDNFKELWKIYAKEFLGITNHIPNKVLINYNKLATNDIRHIEDIKNQLNGHFNKINTVMGHGNGSSFPNDKNYNSRYRLLDNTHKNVLKEWWNDPEIKDLHKKIFNFTPEFDN